MVDVTTAVRNASKYFKEIESALNGNAPENLRLEEVEQSGAHWLITLGHDVRSALAPTPSVFDTPLTSNTKWEYVREYKRFYVDATTGEVKSMKIRKV